MTKDYLTTTLMYLGCYDENKIEECELKKIKEAMQVIKDKSCFRIIDKKYSLDDSIVKKFMNDNPSEDLKFYLKGCNKILIVIATLGIEIDRIIKKETIMDMSNAVILDGAASAWLEVSTDKAQENMKLEAHTFRFAPGYGDIPIEWNSFFATDMMADKKIGVTLSESGLFIPQKSMLGIIGIGSDKAKKQCGNCIRKSSCALRKQSVRCWSKE